MALKAGPKSRDVRPLPRAAGPVELIELVTGQSLYAWQKPILRDLAAPDRPRVAYVQVARKQGKTRLAAAVALVEVLTKPQRHVYAIADSERNLNSVLMREIRDIIGGSALLRDSVHIFKSGIEVPETGSFIETRAANFRASQGINPHTVLFDEVHLQRSDDIWSGMMMAGGAREDFLLLGITTPGYDLSSMAHGLYQQAKAGSAGFYSRIFEPADPDADIDDREAWRQANPRLDDDPRFLAALEFDRQNLPEHEFRRFRLGQWTATETAWLPYGAWDALAAPRPLPEDGARVWLGFDGSLSRDSTALVGVTEDRHVFVVGCWEAPGRRGWKVPREEVQAKVHEAFGRWRVVEMHCDPPYWEREVKEWQERYGEGRVLEFLSYVRNQIAPATTAFYSAVMEGALSHDGDPRLARHLANCVVKPTPLGDVITKADKDSPAKIDLAIAAAMAHLAVVRARPARRKVYVL